MKKLRSHQGSQKIDLYPRQRRCPGCGERLEESYRQGRYVVTLSGTVRLTRHVLKCQTEACPQRDQRWRPEEEGALVLPHYTFALEVVARIGELRYRQQATIGEIASELLKGGVRISIKEVQLLSEVFLALVETVIKDDGRVVEQLREQGGIVLAIDGVQPEKGNETLWLLRDLESGRVLVARNLLSSGSLELSPLIGEVKELGVPILGVISDKQESLCLAIERELPGVAHQLCQFHYLRDVAQPVCQADRKLKKQLKHRVRGIREVERQVASKESDEAQITRGYCLAVREVMRDDGKYPLEPAGITLYDKLDQIGASLERAISKRASQRLCRLLLILDAITTWAQAYTRLVIAWSWIHCLARLLDQGATRVEAEAQLRQYAASLPRQGDRELDEIAAHIEKLTRAFAPKLFAFHDQPLLPKTNNELEVFIGQLKKGRRRVTGRKDTCAFILREGRAVAILQSLRSEPSWMESFAAVDIEHFQKSLAELRRAEQRSQAWRARRDLQAYLSHLEQGWKPPDSAISL
jgi:hypothetical protein